MRKIEVLLTDGSTGFIEKQPTVPNILQQKDLRLVIEAAQEMGVSVPGTSLVNQFFVGLISQGLGNEGTQALVKAHEQLSNVKARV